ncbi:MAG: ATP-binding cassette domain-containing protein [Nocardioidaceae bacterium]
MIELSGVTKTYPGGTQAVKELDLVVQQGEIVCLVGPSGCGKSTTLKMINRLIEPTSGTIWVNGIDITQTDPVQLRRSIGYVIQHVGLFPHQRILAMMSVPRLLGVPKSVAASRAQASARPGRAGPS